MSTDAPVRDASRSRTAARRTFRRAIVILAAASWTAFVWLGRLSLVLDDRNAVPFRVVHGVLIVVSLAFAVALGVIGVRMLAESRRRDGGDA